MSSNDQNNEIPKAQIREGTNLKDFCDNLGVRARDLIEALNKQGIKVGVHHDITEEIASLITKISGVAIEITSIEDEVSQLATSDPEELVPRSPVVTIMGHVDHGKTTLLDAIRESNIVNKEFGGITQHIGAYRVDHKGNSITFIDTPGHEAFTRMRARGANATDIVILVVAADDGVMPQTKEAINHAKAADVPILVAINKIDMTGADPDKAKQQLSKEGLLVEDWGGDVVSVEVSAKEKTNLDTLLEMIGLISEMLELKGNPNVPAQGVVLEARLDAQKGPLATVIIQQGTLYQGDAFISGIRFGKARALFDEHGKPLKQSGLSMPVEVMGFSDVPQAGDLFQAVSDLETAKHIVSYRLSKLKEDAPQQRKEHLTLDQLFKSIEGGETKELSLIIKGDVHGSVDTLNDILPNLSTEQVTVKILHYATGNVTEQDIVLASASNAIILGYNIKPLQNILDLAKTEHVEVRTYTVIYQLMDDIKKAMHGLLDPVLKETYLGRAQIKRVFLIPRAGEVAGCLVMDGKITRNSNVRLLRGEEVIHEGRISSLKHLKNNVTEVKKDHECGIGLDRFKGIQEGDIIEAYVIEKVAPPEL
ncbi:MAG: translation initiation factor IF-2 [Candidatus Aminicenantaceae bacterium]